MAQQIFIVHGGEVFETYEEYIKYLQNYEVNLDKFKYGDWKDHLQETLGNDYEVIYPEMPSKRNAKYSEWKIWFERFIPFLKDGVILIGNSLGGMFIPKYISENGFPVKIKAVFLLAAPYITTQNVDKEYSTSGFILLNSLKKFEDQAEKIFLYNSQDDPVVPFSDQEKYAQALPKAEKIIFEDKGHFALKEFPEIVDKIINLK